MKRIFLVALTLFTSLTTTSAFSAETVNIYSFRQPFLIEPILEQFTAETGIKTKVVFSKKGLIERLKREGKYSPADVVLTSNFNKLLQLKGEGLTQEIKSEQIDKNVPSQFRDEAGHWVALTKRARSLYVSKSSTLNTSTISYEDLSGEALSGKVCTRSGKHPYNLGLIASMIAHHGEAETETWLKGVKANLARKPQGNDRGQVKAIKEGLCEVSLGNSYYYGKMLTDENQKPWADAVNLVFPNQDNRGTHINVSGAVLTKYAPNKANAETLIAYLVGKSAQEQYASVNMEYPVNPSVKPSEMVLSWGEFKEDNISLTEVAKYREQALQLVDKVKFDL
ncbi:extracellular solute-binding protein [Psychrosphaera haliotis]|uniref:Extracellular solute-binding protein n=1 Tax=Psychrosphaera haliotis TaxID=555083 RepID=A0A6N8FA39_9GAMM|nr:extracellular solute-binding protein [Psychrosphaera haliotis]MUH72984.1 extracellular solute-binding protein [Psychrosphaera haliotis]